jgi:hypothetical protein
MKPKFQFGNVVVVDKNQIGLIVKTWENTCGSFTYEIYVRSYNGIHEYTENGINHFVYSKELSEDEKELYE